MTPTSFMSMGIISHIRFGGDVNDVITMHVFATRTVLEIHLMALWVEDHFVKGVDPW